MNKMVVGFLFSPDKKRVVLIKKKRPDWQKGLYNGVGGHVESNESPLEAMHREFNEEAGVNPRNWQVFAKGSKKGNDVLVFFFRSFDEEYYLAETMQDEKVYTKDVYKVRYLKRVYNLDWLISLAMDENTIMTEFTFTLPNNGIQP